MRYLLETAFQRAGGGQRQQLDVAAIARVGFAARGFGRAGFECCAAQALKRVEVLWRDQIELQAASPTIGLLAAAAASPARCSVLAGGATASRGAVAAASAKGEAPSAASVKRHGKFRSCRAT